MHRLLLLLNLIMLLLVVGLGYLVVGLLWERGPVPALPSVLQPVVAPTAVSALAQAASTPPNGPTLAIPTIVVERSQTAVRVPVTFSAASTHITSLLFSLDYDPTVLHFDPTDADGDGLPEAIQFTLPPEFTPIITFAADDGDGEIDVAIFDAAPPFTALPDASLFYVTFTVQAPLATEVAFSAAPAPSFGDLFGQRVLGQGQTGAVCVGADAPGCPADGAVLVAPLPTPVAIVTVEPALPVAETAVPQPTFAPVCTNLLVNGNAEGVDGWEVDQTAYTAGYAHSPVLGGQQALRLGIPDAADNVRSFSAVRQTVTVPAAANSVWLRFSWLPVSGAGQEEGDYQYAMVLEQERPLIQQLVQTNGWQPHQFDLTPFAGQTITLAFGVFNDGSGGATALFLDDVALEICR
jgi:hypothetical protein